MYNLFFIDILKSIVYFPLWWYGRGFLRSARNLKEDLYYYWAKLGVGIWIKYWFVPMYGQRDFWGRVVSILMRTFNIIGRLLVYIVYFIFFVSVFLLKLFLPIILIWLIILQLSKIF